MRFKGTLILMIACLGFGAFLYYYEIKGGEQRKEAEQREKQVWKVESADIQRIDLSGPNGNVSAERTGPAAWKIVSPRPLAADSAELDRLAGSAAEISRDSVVAENAADLSPFGLNPAKFTLAIRTKDNKERKILFGNDNPTGSLTYAAVAGSEEVVLLPKYTAQGFNKKLDDLRDHSVLNFDQPEVRSVTLRSEKGDVKLVKENDKWWIDGKVRWAADSSSVSSLLGALSSGRVKEFFDQDPNEYRSLGFEHPSVDVRLAVGKDMASKHLVIGFEQSKLKKVHGAAAEGSAGDLYVARDDSRDDLFLVEKDLVDKLLKSRDDLRDKTLASFQRWDVDSIEITGGKGTVRLSKSDSGGDWVAGADKKKAKWDAVNGILDALEKPVEGFVDEPAGPAAYGLDKPAVRVVLRQGGKVKLDCAFGKDAKKGVYAQVKGEPYVKIASLETLDKIDRPESEFIETPAKPAPAPKAETPSKK